MHEEKEHRKKQLKALETMILPVLGGITTFVAIILFLAYFYGARESLILNSAIVASITGILSLYHGFKRNLASENED